MLNLRRCVGGLVAVLLVGAAGCSSPPQTETDAANAGDAASQFRWSDVPGQAWESLNNRAAQGDAVAQSNLGTKYFNGEGVPQDYVQAVSWWRKAAEQGDADAQKSLGYAYATGEGVPQDHVQSVSWFRQAAEQGYANAQHNLGNAYDRGQGVPQDYAQAVSWSRQAAEQGHADAQYNLGNAYSNGQGVPQDYVESHKWRNLAASRASAEDQERYAESRDALARRSTLGDCSRRENLRRHGNPDKSGKRSTRRGG